MPAQLLPSLLFALCCAPPSSIQEAGQPAFDALLERVKKEDPKVDFAALRMAFTRTPGYTPYAGSRPDRDAMRAAFEQKDHDKALALAQKVLQKNYVDLDAHLIALRAFTEKKDQEKAKYHRYVLQGLLDSILKSGDGKSPATAFVVISTDEVYAALGALGVRRMSQALMKKDGHSYDRMEGTDRDGKRVTLFFNIDQQMEWLGRSLKKGS